MTSPADGGQATSRPRKTFELSFGQKITTQYVIALGLIAVLVVASHLSLLETMAAHVTWASIINLSGKQRMLSQRISRLAHDLVDEGPEKRGGIRAELTDRAAQMEAAHKEIISGAPESEYKVPLSKAAREILFYPPHELDKKLQRFIQAVKSLSGLPSGELSLQNDYFLIIEEYSERPLLDSLDALVTQFQAEAEQNAASLRKRETIITALLLMTIVIVGVAIFQPLAWRIQRSADELSESQRKLAGIAASLGEGVLVTDREGIITFANPMAQNLTGYKEQDLVGLPVMDMKIFNLDGAPAPKEEQVIFQALSVSPQVLSSESDPHVRTREMILERKMGDRLIIEMSATRLWQKGEVAGAVASMRDVTMRKTMEAILAAKSDMVQLLQEIAFAVNDAETVDEAMVVCLKKVCKHTIWEIGHVFKPGQDDILYSTDLWHGKDYADFEMFRKVTESVSFKPGVGLPGRVALSKKPAWIKDVRKDGNFPRWSGDKDFGVRAGLAFPVLEGGVVVAVLEFFSMRILEPDESMMTMAQYLSTQLGRVTERKRDMEAIKKAKDVAEDATRMKDKFLALVAHDMRAPLTTMLGLVKSIKTDAAHPLSSSQQGLVSKVVITGENMLELIDNLLDLERLQTGQMRVEKMSLDARALAEEVIESLSYEAAAKNLILRNEVERGVKILADYELIIEVFKNIVHNAVKFCSEGDQITIFRHPGDTPIIGVKDTGPGVRREIIGDLFRHDIKTSTIGTAGERGTGLGLPLCQDIMKAHEGELIAVAGEGGGATFLVRFPAVAALPEKTTV